LAQARRFKTSERTDNEVPVQMRCLFGLFVCVLGCCMYAADARSNDIVESRLPGLMEGKKEVVADRDSGISPSVTQSDKKFFGKDYPWDKRPKADILHFKHPYPIVQDSGDYDDDYVKDENSDNGSWKAQTEYDRLRHQLAKERADVAKASVSTSKAEKELHDAIEREKHAKKVHEAWKRKHEEMQRNKKAADEHHEKHHEMRTKNGKEETSVARTAMKWKGGVKDATGDTQKAMAKLEDCKKELAKARESLKKLMKKLEAAKHGQGQADDGYDAQEALGKKLAGHRDSLDKSAKSNYQKYLDSREAYLRQLALLSKMEQDIKVAAEKVRAFRDAADAGGGVYPAQTKSGSPSSSSFVGALLFAIFAYGAQVAN